MLGKSENRGFLSPKLSKITPPECRENEPTSNRSIGKNERSSSAEIPLLSHVLVGEVIGKGNFGVVRKGKWQKKTLGLKMLHGKPADVQNELNLLMNLNHENVLPSYGLFIQSPTELYLATEYMENGDLLNLLRNHEDLSVDDLISFTTQTAKGMEYLHSENILHRDLAARNLLVTMNTPLRGTQNLYTLKIADFGLSRKTEDYYQLKSTKIPIRWTAPEVYEFAKATSASDVWSYGVVLWEIFSHGAIPYAGDTNQKVIQRIRNGLRLPIPLGTPGSISQLMSACWNSSPADRPSFAAIVQNLTACQLSDSEMIPFRYSSNPSFLDLAWDCHDTGKSEHDFEDVDSNNDNEDFQLSSPREVSSPLRKKRSTEDLLQSSNVMRGMQQTIMNLQQELEKKHQTILSHSKELRNLKQQILLRDHFDYYQGSEE